MEEGRKGGCRKEEVSEGRRRVGGKREERRNGSGARNLQ